MKKSFVGVKSVPIFYLWAVIGAFSMYLLRLLLARSLTPEQYGTFYAIIGLLLFLGIFNDAGLGVSLLYHFNKWKGRSAEIFTIVALAKSIISISLGILLFFNRHFLATKFFHLPELSTPLLFFCIYFFLEGVEVLLLNYFGAIGALKRCASMAHFRRIITLLFAGGVTLLLREEWRLYGFLFSWVFAYLITNILYLWNMSLTKLFKRPRKGLGNKIYTYAGFMFLSGAGGVILQRIDVLFITFYRGSIEVGFYEIALPLATILLTFVSPLLAYLQPTIVARHQEKRSDSLSNMFTLLYDVGFFLLLPLTLFIAFFAKEIILVLFGQPYVLSEGALIFLVSAYFFESFKSINFIFLYGTGRAKIQMYILWIGAIINIILNFFLIPTYGFVAAALTTLITSILMFFFSFFSVRRHLTFSLPLLNWLKTLSLSFFTLFTIFFLKRAFEFSLFFEATFLGSFFIIVYFGIGIFFLKIIEPKAILSLFKNLTKTFGVNRLWRR